MGYAFRFHVVGLALSQFDKVVRLPTKEFLSHSHYPCLWRKRTLPKLCINDPALMLRWQSRHHHSHQVDRCIWWFTTSRTKPYHHEWGATLTTIQLYSYSNKISVPPRTRNYGIPNEQHTLMLLIYAFSRMKMAHNTTLSLQRYLSAHIQYSIIISIRRTAMNLTPLLTDLARVSTRLPLFLFSLNLAV